MDKSLIELIQTILYSDYSPTVKLAEIQRVIDIVGQHKD